jgi:7-cyano-7-deazaguanine synthase
MDSIALLWWTRPDVAYTVDYGQLAARGEIAASAAVCRRMGILHEVIKVDCAALGSGDMAGTAQNVHAPASDWWPYRNQLLITLVAMRAIGHEVGRILIGTVRSDSGHQDGTIDFIAAMSRVLQSQEGAMTVEAPAINMTTAELIQRSGVPGEMLAWAHSCHKADVVCGSCRGCNKYFEVFAELGYDLDRIGEPNPA